MEDEGEKARGAEGHICLAVSHLGPAPQTQAGNAHSTLVLSSLKKIFMLN